MNPNNELNYDVNDVSADIVPVPMGNYNCELPIPPNVKDCNINVAGFSFDELKSFDPTGYTIMCRIGEKCDGLSYFPKNSKVVLSVGEQSKPIYNFQDFQTKIGSEIAKDLRIPQEVANKQLAVFFNDNDLVVMPGGLQGKAYGLMRYLQNYYPMMSTTRMVAAMKTTGISGWKALSGAPLSSIGAAYVGGQFMTFCGCILGNNTAGNLFTGAGYVLVIPMRLVEEVMNGLVLRPVSNLVGMPLLLNGTKEMVSGIGIPIKEYLKIAEGLERLTNTKVYKKALKVYKIIRND
jgi:hypothetical protein